MLFGPMKVLVAVDMVLLLCHLKQMDIPVSIDMLTMPQQQRHVPLDLLMLPV
jgi:hypothetical protein